MTTYLILIAVLSTITVLATLVTRLVRSDGLGHSPLPPRFEDQSPWHAYRG